MPDFAMMQVKMWNVMKAKISNIYFITDAGIALKWQNDFEQFCLGTFQIFDKKYLAEPFLNIKLWSQ